MLSHFSPFSSSQYRGYIRDEWLDTGLLDWLAQLPGSLKGHGVITVKDSRTTSLFRVAVSEQKSAIIGQPSAVSNYSTFRIPQFV